MPYPNFHHLFDTFRLIKCFKFKANFKTSSPHSNINHWIVSMPIVLVFCVKKDIYEDWDMSIEVLNL